MTIAVEPPRAADPVAPPALGRSVWRREQAARAALLHDGAAYFAAARAALLAARRSILLIGWSFDPRTRLRPGTDGESLGDLLVRLKAERPELAVRLLVWTLPWPLSANTDMKPEAVRAQLGPGIDYRVDAALPYGACQHQKILVVDDRVAFCGGSDFEANRWDTPAHRDRETRRRLPSGEPYPPRHDVMMLVDGSAARALGDLARRRWLEATGETLAPEPPAAPETPDADPAHDPWPGAVVPDLEGVGVALARTAPGIGGRAEIRECEALYLDQIRAARRTIYLENQYFTSPLIARALARRLAEPDGPEIVVVLAACSPNGFDRLTMDSARRGLIRWLRSRDRHDRFRIRAPHTERGLPILVHSKVAVFDDRVLRVGSANLNNRSFGYDSECDLVVEAADGPAGAATRAAIARLRDRLLAHHAACPPESFAAAAARGGLCAALDDPGLAPTRRLCGLVASHRSLLARFIEAFHIGDPVGIGDAWRPWRRRRLIRRMARTLPEA